MAKPPARRRAARPTTPAARPIAKEPVAAPSFDGYEPHESSSNATTIVFMPLLGIAVLLFVAASISPAYVPWPPVAARLHAYRSDLVVLGLGAAGIALVALSLQRLGA